MWIANLPFYKKMSAQRSLKLSNALHQLMEHEQTLLDFGCGNFFTSLALSRVRPELKITGIDVIQDQNINLQQLESAGHQFMAYPGGKLPFNDQAFDGAIVLSALHHTPDPEAYIRELKRVTKSGGHLYIVEEMYLHLLDRVWISAQDWLLNKLKKGVPVPLQFRSHKHYLSFFAQEDLHVEVETSVRPGFPWMHHYVFKLTVHH